MFNDNKRNEKKTNDELFINLLSIKKDIITEVGVALGREALTHPQQCI